MVFRLLGACGDGAEGFFQELGRLFTIRALEGHCLNTDFTTGFYSDFDGALGFHQAPPITSLMAPLAAALRCTE